MENIMLPVKALSEFFWFFINAQMFFIEQDVYKQWYTSTAL